jgi:hypothetical protein
VKRSDCFWIASGVMMGEEFRRIGTGKTLGSAWECNGKHWAMAAGQPATEAPSRQAAKRIVEEKVCG